MKLCFCNEAQSNSEKPIWVLSIQYTNDIDHMACGQCRLCFSPYLDRGEGGDKAHGDFEPLNKMFEQTP